MLFYAIYILSYCTWENNECNKYMQIHQSYRVGLYLWYSELFTYLSLWNVSPWLSIDGWRSDVSIESNLGCLPCGVYNFKENPSVTFVLAFKWTAVFLEYLNLLLFWQNFMSLLEPCCFNPPVDWIVKLFLSYCLVWSCGLISACSLQLGCLGYLKPSFWPKSSLFT